MEQESERDSRMADDSYSPAAFGRLEGKVDALDVMVNRRMGNMESKLDMLIQGRRCDLHTEEIEVLSDRITAIETDRKEFLKSVKRMVFWSLGISFTLYLAMTFELWHHIANAAKP
jgi:hypothetical protein